MEGHIQGRATRTPDRARAKDAHIVPGVCSTASSMEQRGRIENEEEVGLMDLVNILFFFLITIHNYLPSSDVSPLPSAVPVTRHSSPPIYLQFEQGI